MVMLRVNKWYLSLNKLKTGDDNINRGHQGTGAFKFLHCYFKEGIDGHVRERGLEVLLLEHWSKEIITNSAWISINIEQNGAGNIWRGRTLRKHVQFLSAHRGKRRGTHTHRTKEIQQFSERLCILFHVYRSNIVETEHKGYAMLIYISRFK